MADNTAFLNAMLGITEDAKKDLDNIDTLIENAGLSEAHKVMLLMVKNTLNAQIMIIGQLSEVACQI